MTSLLSRYRNIGLIFYDRDLDIITGGDTRQLLSVETTTILNGIGTFSCTYPWPTGVTPAFGVPEKIGNIVCFTYSDYHYGGVGFPGGHRALGEAYIIEKIEASNTESGQVIRLSGRSLMSELEGFLVWEPIGELHTYNTTLKVAITGEVATTMNGAVNQGEEMITVVSSTGIKETDMLTIAMATGGYAYMIVSSIGEDDEVNQITLTGPLPGNVSSGASVVRHARKVIPTSTTGMKIGSKITLTLNTGTHTTLIETEPEVDEDDESYILLRDPIPSAANVGKAIATSDRSEPAANDIEQIMSFAPGWTETETGFGNGSAHVPDGQSVLELLQTVAAIHRTPFRLALLSTTLLPTRQLVWGLPNSGSTPGSSKIILANPPQSLLSTYMAENRGVVNGGISNEERGPFYTRVYPTSGSDEITLFGVSPLTIPLLDPYLLVNDPDVLGLYSDPYIYDPTLEATGYISGKLESFSHITAETSGIDSYTSASDMLAIEAMSWLAGHSIGGYHWVARDVMIYSTAQLFVGQKVDVHYYETASQDRPSHIYHTRENLIVTEISASWNAGDSRPRIDVTMDSTMVLAGDSALRAAQKFRTYDRMVRRMATGNIEGRSIVVRAVSTSPPPSGGSGYLPLTGGYLTGNVTAASGVTIDTVDISAHAANASAHHAPVTATDGTIALSGQAVSVALDTGRSITLATGIGVNLNASGGLEHSSNSLRIKTHTDSGLQVSAGGVRLVPEGVSASTGNTVTTIYHSHQVVANSDVIAGASALLKSDTGQLSLRRLGIGVVADSSAALYVKAVSAGNKSVWIKQVAGQTGDMLRIEDQWGDPLIRLTGGGDLESGTPQYTSGLVGWQIAADGSAEFNNVRVRGELHAATFVADEITAAGGTIIVKTAGTIGPPQATGHNVIPALNASFYLVVKKSWDTAANYFPVGSILRVKTMGEVVSGGSLDLFDLYMEVTAVAAYDDRDLANGEAGNIRLTCTFRHGGTMNGSSGDATGFEIPAGSAVVLWTEVGASGYTGAIKLTTDGDVVNDETEAPLIDIFTVGKKTSASWGGVIPTLTPRVRIGNLRGVLGKTSDEWGMAAGTNLGDGSDDAPRIVASDLGVNLYNVNLSMYSGSTEVMRLDPSVPSFGLGSTLPTGTQAGGDGFWVGHIGSNKYAVRVGGIYSYAPQLLWDGNNNTLSLRDKTGAEKIVFDASGNSYFAGPMTLGTNGGIWQGTGTFASPTTGLKIWRDGTAGRLATYNGGTAQVYLDTNGYFFAGGGKVKVAADGLTLESYAAPGTGWYSVYDSPLALKFRKADGTYTGHIASLTNGSVHNVSITAGGAGSGHHILVSTAGITLDTTGTIQIGNVASDASTIYFDGDIVQNSGTASFSFAGMALNPHTVSASYEIVSGNAVFAGTFLKAGTGITVGENVVSTPGNGTILIDGLASAPSAPSGTEVALYVVLSGSTYTLYMKKPGGSTVTIASV